MGLLVRSRYLARLTVFLFLHNHCIPNYWPLKSVLKPSQSVCGRKWVWKAWKRPKNMHGVYTNLGSSRRPLNALVRERRSELQYMAFSSFALDVLWANVTLWANATRISFINIHGNYSFFPTSYSANMSLCLVPSLSYQPTITSYDTKAKGTISRKASLLQIIAGELLAAGLAL